MNFKPYGEVIGQVAAAKKTDEAMLTSGLEPNVDPDKTYGDIAIRQYGRYISEFRPFEEEMVANRNDTSLVDAVPDDVEQQSNIAEGIAKRNRDRIGFEETKALSNEREASSERGESLALAGGLNNARLAQLDANNRTLSELINIGQGVNQSSLQGLGAAAQNDVTRQNAYTQAKSAYRAQQRQAAGQALGTAAAIGTALYFF